ncbi:MAG: hypothetical protein N2688_04955 [Burkholderiaceae bacterium]|nr:hypothetical protein [Burkholderiaceae bacterium]
MDVGALATAALRPPVGGERAERIATTLRALAPLLAGGVRLTGLQAELARAVAQARADEPAYLVLPLGAGPLRLEFGNHRFTLPASLRAAVLARLGGAPPLPAVPPAAGTQPAFARAAAGPTRDARPLAVPAREAAVPLALADEGRPAAVATTAAGAAPVRPARDEGGEAVRFEVLQQAAGAAGDGAAADVALQIGREWPRWGAEDGQPVFAARLSLELPPLGLVRIAVRVSGELGQLAWQWGRPEQALQHYMAALQAAETAGLWAWAGDMARAIGNLYAYALNLPAEARACYRRAAAAYAAATEYGVAEVPTAATFHTAELYHDFGRALLSSQRPKRLSKLELEQYNVMLEEQAFPFEEKAIELHEINARRSASGIYDEWVKRSFASLAKLRPARYAKVEVSEATVDAIR